MYDAGLYDPLEEEDKVRTYIFLWILPGLDPMSPLLTFENGAVLVNPHPPFLNPHSPSGQTERRRFKNLLGVKLPAWAKFTLLFIFLQLRIFIYSSRAWFLRKWLQWRMAIILSAKFFLSYLGPNCNFLFCCVRDPHICEFFQAGLLWLHARDDLHDEQCERRGKY